MIFNLCEESYIFILIKFDIRIDNQWLKNSQIVNSQKINKLEAH